MRNLVGVLLFVALGQVGCASVINGTTQDVGFRSIPPGANVNVSGQTATTPAKLTLSRDRSHTATFTKEGYPERQVVLKQNLDGAFYGNIALGGIIGMTVDMSNGAAYKLSPKNVEVDLANGLVREFDSGEAVRIVEGSPPSPPLPPPPARPHQG